MDVLDVTPVYSDVYVDSFSEIATSSAKLDLIDIDSRVHSLVGILHKAGEINVTAGVEVEIHGKLDTNGNGEIGIIPK